MNVRVLLGAAAALTLAGAAVAVAKEVRIERNHTCVCTGEPGVAPVPPVPPVPPIPPGAHWQMELQDSDEPHVYTFRQGGDDEQVIVIRKRERHDSADDNKDGKVTRREFMRRAEKHFKERDKNGDGKLDGDELAPRNFMFPPPPPPATPAPHEDD